MIQLPSNKTTPYFQRLPMSKVDQSYLHIHEVPPLQSPKGSIIRLQTVKNQVGSVLFTKTESI